MPGLHQALLYRRGQHRGAGELAPGTTIASPRSHRDLCPPRDLATRDDNIFVAIARVIQHLSGQQRDQHEG